MDDAAKDLTSKALAGHWNTLVFGALPFIVCYAAAGHRIQFCLIERDSTVLRPIHGQLDMLQVGHSPHCASRCTLHFLVKGDRHIASQI